MNPAQQAYKLLNENARLADLDAMTLDELINLRELFHHFSELAWTRIEARRSNSPDHSTTE